MVKLSEETKTALLLITHDLGVVAETCTRMITMYASEIVEEAPVDPALMRPRHPYTSGLLGSLPQISRARGEFAYVPGRVPSPLAMPEGCRFRDRCPHAAGGCERPQALEASEPARLARCHRQHELELPGAVA